MRDSLKNKCELFAENYNVLSKKFNWNYTTSIRMGALLYTMEGKPADIEAAKRCKTLIKENTGVFSQFKDTTYFMTSIMLSLKEDPEGILKKALDIYAMMKTEGFHSSSYLVLAALSIAMQADQSDYHRIVYKTKEYYDAMKREHWFITSSDDYGFAALLAMSDKDMNHAIREMENCYRKLKENFSYSNAVQSLSHVLTFSEEETITKCNKVTQLRHALKNRKCKFGNGMELSFLGVVSLLDEDPQKLADEIAETKEYLKTKKGFGWTVSSKERIMYSVALVCDDYLEDVKKDTIQMTLANNVANILLAQQMAVIAASSSAAASAAAASSN